MTIPTLIAAGVALAALIALGAVILDRRQIKADLDKAIALLTHHGDFIEYVRGAVEAMAPHVVDDIAAKSAGTVTVQVKADTTQFESAIDKIAAAGVAAKQALS